MNELKLFEKDLQNILQENNIFSSEAIVLKQNENSDLIPIAKTSSKEFLEEIFSSKGPFWTVYSNLGFGIPPSNSKYLNFVGNKVFFCKNVEKKFFNFIGLEKKIILKNNKIKEEIRFNLINLIFLLLTPIELIKQFFSNLTSILKINEKLDEFIEFSIKSKNYWNENKAKKFSNPVLIASEALNNSLKAMEYSFYSSFALHLKIKLKNSKAWKECELEELEKILKEDSKKLSEKTQQYGFYSTSPYDISLPRLSENPYNIIEYGIQTTPQNPAIKWRENCKFLAARYLDIQRKAYLQIGNESGLKDLVFFLTTSELNELKNNFEELKKIAIERKTNYDLTIKSNLSKEIIYFKEWILTNLNKSQEIMGESVGSPLIVQGKIVCINSFKDFNKDVNEKIIVSSTLNSELVTLYGKIKGIISEGGGQLAHAAIVAREQKMPCIVQVKNFEKLKEGQKVELNGETGEIKIVN